MKSDKTRQDKTRQLVMQTPKMARDWRHKLLQKKVMRDAADNSFKIRKGEGLNPQNL